MAKGINKVILVGNLGADPDVRFTSSGAAICRLSVATSETWVDKQSGEKQERTEWHRVVAFGKLGEICGEYLAKGRQVYVEGALRTENYTDKQGVDRWSTEVIAVEVQFLGGEQHAGGGSGRSTGSHGGGRSSGGGGRSSGGGGRQAPAREAPQREPAAPRSSRPDDGAFVDDEIPF
jgi:single-strand DNA-binding protein